MPSPVGMPDGMVRRHDDALVRDDVNPRFGTTLVTARRLNVCSWLVLALLLGTLLPGYASAESLAAPSAISEDAATIARRYVGAPYRYGGAGPRSFDCSGLTMFVFGQLGVQLPHNAASQYNAAGTRIGSLAELAPGDLVFFVRTTGRRGITHAAIYVGDGHMVSANTPRTGVQLNNIHDGYWRSRFAGGLRIQRYKRGVIGG